MKIVESQFLHMEDVREMCIKNEFYTKGTNEEYENMFNMIRRINEKPGIITVEDLLPIAQDIMDHSDDEYGIEDMMLCLGARIIRCYNCVE